MLCSSAQGREQARLLCKASMHTDGCAGCCKGRSECQQIRSPGPEKVQSHKRSACMPSACKEISQVLQTSAHTWLASTFFAASMPFASRSWATFRASSAVALHTTGLGATTGARGATVGRAQARREAEEDRSAMVCGLVVCRQEREESKSRRGCAEKTEGREVCAEQTAVRDRTCNQ